jgi:hypothetical protein
MARSLRDLLVLLMVMWIPTSIVLFMRHSNQMQEDIQRDLLKQLHDTERQWHPDTQPQPLHDNLPVPHSPGALYMCVSCSLRDFMCNSVPVDAPATPQQSRNDGLIFSLNDVVKPHHGQLRGNGQSVTSPDSNLIQGWPYDPVFDANGRAIEVTDLDDAIRNGKWQESCRDIIAKNKYLLEASAYHGAVSFVRYSPLVTLRLCPGSGGTPTNVTLVSGIWDLGRDKIAVEGGNDFRRPFTMYTDAMKLFLDYKFPKVLYLERKHFDILKPAVSGRPVCINAVRYRHY